MISTIGLWVLLTLATDSSVTAINVKRQWKWTNEPLDMDLTPQVGDIMYEEIATVPLQSNVSCRKDIDNIISHIPSIDDSMSYQTTYHNGTKTYTLFQVKEVTECNIQNMNHEQRLQRRTKLLGKRRKPKSKRRVSSVNVSSAIVSCGYQCPWQCDGVLVGHAHILTSAHCLDNLSPRNVKVGFLSRGGRVEWYNSEKFYIPRKWLTIKKGPQQYLEGTKYDYSLIRLNRSPGRPGLSMQPSPTFLRGNDEVIFQGFDNNLNLYQSMCSPLTMSYGIELNFCSNTAQHAGSGILVGNAWSGYALVGVLSDRRLGGRAVATALTQKKIHQILNWINN